MSKLAPLFSLFGGAGGAGRAMTVTAGAITAGTVGLGAYNAIDDLITEPEKARRTKQAVEAEQRQSEAIEGPTNLASSWGGFLGSIARFFANFLHIPALSAFVDFMDNEYKRAQDKVENFFDRGSDDKVNDTDGRSFSYLPDVVADHADEAAMAGAGLAVGFGVHKGLKHMGGGSATAGASSLGPKAMNLLRKIPGLNRILPVALVGAGVTMMATDDAHAGQPETTGYSNQPGVPSQSVSVSPEGISGTEIAAAGVSFAAKSTAEGVGSLAARFGLRAIPGIAAVVVAGDNLYDTAKYALRGEFAKAGTQVVAGFAETVAYIPGAITGVTFGTALKEGIRAGAVGAFGEEIEHSMPVQLAQGVSEIVGSTTAPAANDKTFRLASGM
ncbi:MAG: hypothetical protein H6855_05280 [Rhodospirillales bacterium]|nr:hypothetical protein [Rhodospirillales bacterium]